jgi:hypothetical protein
VTIPFFDSDDCVAKNLKWFVYCFEQMLRLRINYHRSDLMKINVEPKDARDFAQTSYRILGKFLSNILGILSFFS